ncbi:hypothetical protein [Helicobacter heilmannii]|uniref:hypothetical protein n=1 Tax=Helicobacter heilmannii TaxID=35817 RepID=UPI0006A0907C|nr:hypothetical protein [Helicobacter heilmannii]CRF45730.1 hypothetical protein HHE014_07010 [Helicobacter heilmannii]
MKTSKRPFSLALVASLSLSSFALADNTTDSQAAMIVNSLSGLLGSSYTINSSGYAYQTPNNAPAPIYSSTSTTAPLSAKNTPIGQANTALNPNIFINGDDPNYTVNNYALFSPVSQQTYTSIAQQNIGPQIPAYGLLETAAQDWWNFSYPPSANRYDINNLTQLKPVQTFIAQNITAYQDLLNFAGGGGGGNPPL